jgi:hypothetical protein
VTVPIQVIHGIANGLILPGSVSLLGGRGMDNFRVRFEDRKVAGILQRSCHDDGGYPLSHEQFELDAFHADVALGISNGDGIRGRCFL